MRLQTKEKGACYAPFSVPLISCFAPGHHRPLWDSNDRGSPGFRSDRSKGSSHTPGKAPRNKGRRRCSSFDHLRLNRTFEGLEFTIGITPALTAKAAGLIAILCHAGAAGSCSHIVSHRDHMPLYVHDHRLTTGVAVHWFPFHRNDFIPVDFFAAPRAEIVCWDLIKVVMRHQFSAAIGTPVLRHDVGTILCRFGDHSSSDLSSS